MFAAHVKNDAQEDLSTAGTQIESAAYALWGLLNGSGPEAQNDSQAYDQQKGESFATLWREAPGVWTNREAEDQLKVSQPPWCCANAAPIYPEKIPDSLSASLPLSPQPRAAGTKYPSMEGVRIDNNEQPMTQCELMKGLDAVTRRYARPISGKYTIEQLKAQVGKETGVVFIAVPIEWVTGGNTPGNRQKIANRVPHLLGQAICCRVGTYSGTSKPIGTISILIQQLSEEEAVRLGRWFLRLIGKDDVSTRKGVAVHEKH